MRAGMFGIVMGVAERGQVTVKRAIFAEERVVCAAVEAEYRAIGVFDGARGTGVEIGVVQQRGCEVGESALQRHPVRDAAAVCVDRGEPCRVFQAEVERPLPAHR
jgi:hypothetical protein